MEDIQNKLKTTFLELFDVIPNLIGAIFVLIIGWLLAKILSRLFERILRAIGLDKLGEKLSDIDLIRDSEMEIIPSKILGKLVYYVLLLIFIALAADFLALELVSHQIDNLINYLPSLISGALVFIGGIVISNLVKDVVETTLRSIGVSTGRLIANFIFYFLLITVSLSALTQAQINTSFITSNLTVIIGGIILAFAIGYGFASRNIMANMLGSLYTKQKFQIGEDIKIGDTRGTIIDIDNTSITLKSGDKKVIIPLNRLTTEEVEVFGSWDNQKLLN